MPKEFTIDEQKLLHEAVLNDDLDQVRKMLADGISPEVVVDGLTPLYLASCLGNCDRPRMIDILVDAGANPSRRMMGLDTNVSLRTPLNGAAKSGQLDAVERLLDHGADPRSTDNDEKTAAHLLLESKADATKVCSLLNYMLERGVPVNHPDADGSTLLHAAVKQSWPLPVLRLLFDRGADLNARDDTGATALYYAKDVATARALIERGTDLRSLDNDGREAFHALVSQSIAAAVDVQVPLYLLAQGSDPKHADYLGDSAYASISSPDNTETAVVRELRAAISEREARQRLYSAPEKAPTTSRPAAEVPGSPRKAEPITLQDRDRFTSAIQKNDLESVRILVNKGIPPNDPHGGSQPLFLAARTSFVNTEMIDLLVELGADPNILMDSEASQDCRTSLLGAAADGGHENMLRLLEHGANARVSDYYQRTAAHLLLAALPAALQDTDAICDALNRLLDAGVLVNHRDNEGRTPLHIAVKERWPTAVLDALIDRGADINARDIRGRTPLYYADNPVVAASLLDRGAGLHVIDNNGENFFHYQISRIAFHGSDPDLALYALERGANTRQPDKAGITPLDKLATNAVTNNAGIKKLQATIAAQSARAAISNVRSRARSSAHRSAP